MGSVIRFAIAATTVLVVAAVVVVGVNLTTRSAEADFMEQCFGATVVDIDSVELFSAGATTSVLELEQAIEAGTYEINACLLYTSPSPRDRTRSRMPSSA